MLQTIAIVAGIWYAMQCAAILTGWTAMMVVPNLHGWVPPTALPQINQLEIAGMDRLTIDVVPYGIRVLGASAVACEGVALVYAVILVRRITVLISGGRPFDPRVSVAMARVSVVLVAGSILRGVLDVVTISAVHSWFETLVVEHIHAAGGSLSTSPEFPLALFVCGAVAGCLVVAFREGARLQEDAVGVV